MILTLGVITLAASGAVGLVYGVTKEPIEAAKKAKTTQALSQVLPPFEGEPETAIEGNAVIYTVSKAGEVAGYAVESTANGFGGEIKLMTGYTPQGQINRIEVLSHTETPGLGDKIESKKSDFSVQFQGKTPGKDFRMTVKKDGGDVNAITASTISSRAFTKAVQEGYNALQAHLGKAAGDANSGATAQTNQSNE